MSCEYPQHQRLGFPSYPGTLQRPAFLKRLSENQPRPLHSSTLTQKLFQFTPSAKVAALDHDESTRLHPS
jgi:hypothetical protein